MSEDFQSSTSIYIKQVHELDLDMDIFKGMSVFEIFNISFGDTFAKSKLPTWAQKIQCQMRSKKIKVRRI